MSGQRENILGGLVALLATMSLQMMTTSPRHKLHATQKPLAMIDADWYSLNATSLRTMTLAHHGIMPQVVVRATALEKERSLVQVVLAENPYAELFRFDLFLDHNPSTGQFTVTPTHIDIDRHVVQDGMMWYVSAGNGDTIEYMHKGTKPVLLDVHRFLQAPDGLDTLLQANESSKEHQHKKHHKNDDDDDDDESYHTMHGYAKTEGRAYIWAVALFIMECLKNMLVSYALKLALDVCVVYKLDKRLMRRLERMPPFLSIADREPNPPAQPEEGAKKDNANPSSSLVFGSMTFDQVIAELKSHPSTSMEFAFGSVMEDIRRKHKRAANQFKEDFPHKTQWKKIHVTDSLREAYSKIITTKKSQRDLAAIPQFKISPLLTVCSDFEALLDEANSPIITEPTPAHIMERGGKGKPSRARGKPSRARGKPSRARGIPSRTSGKQDHKKKIRKQSITRRKPCASNLWFW